MASSVCFKILFPYIDDIIYSCTEAIFLFIAYFSIALIAVLNVALIIISNIALITITDEGKSHLISIL